MTQLYLVILVFTALIPMPHDDMRNMRFSLFQMYFQATAKISTVSYFFKNFWVAHFN